MRLILIGFAASYKTSAGKILAQKFGTEFWDTDWQVEKSLGDSVARVFQIQGESVFRRAESDVLKELKTASGVISCGGGAVLSPYFKSFAQGGTVVWLQTSAQTVRERLQAGTRPLFDGMSQDQFQQHISLRAPLYEKYASFCISTDGKTSAQVADEAEQKLTLLNCI